MTDTGNALLQKLKRRLNELADNDPGKESLKQVIKIIQDEENEDKNKPTTISSNEQPTIEIDESLLKDAIAIWSEMKPVLKDFIWS